MITFAMQMVDNKNNQTLSARGILNLALKSPKFRLMATYARRQSMKRSGPLQAPNFKV